MNYSKKIKSEILTLLNTTNTRCDFTEIHEGNYIEITRNEQA